MPATPMQMLRAFELAMGGPINELPSRQTLALRLRLIREEYTEVREEFEPALARGTLDIEALTKELCDLLYVIYGTGVAFGIDLDEALRLVHKSNMSKLGPDGKPILDAGGKVMKGASYRPPDLSGVIPEIVDGTCE